MVKLVEIKDLNSLLNQIKTDIERLSSIEVKDNEEVKALKKKLAELETAKKVMNQLGQKTDIIDQQINKIKEELAKKEVKLSDKDKALLKLLELYGVKVNKKTGGNIGKKYIEIYDKNGLVFTGNSYSDICRFFNLKVGSDSPKRVLDRYLRKEAPDVKIFVNGEIYYDGISK